MKKMFSILLVTLMLLSPFAMCVNAESVTEQAVQVKDTNEQKITSDLQAHLDTVDDDEYVPVYVWLNDYGEDMLYEVLSQRLGKSITADTEEAYIKEKVDIKEKLLSKGLENLAKTNEYKLQSMSQGVMDIRNLTGNTFKAQANLSSIMTDEEIDTCIESNMTSSEIIELSERNQFLSDYRQSRKTVNTAVNNTFYNSLDLDKCRNIYLDPLLCRVTMECKKSYVDDIEELSFVNNIGYKYDVVYTNYEEENGTLSETPITYNTNYPMTNNYPYNGAGIRVGAIEAADKGKTYFSTGCLHLKNKNIINNIPESQRVSTNYSDHARDVLSILAGNQVSKDGVTYQGIAPEASLYYTNLNVYGADFVSASLNWMICENNVSVINMSWGSVPPPTLENGVLKYHYNYRIDRDQIIDTCILNYRTIIVLAAGNFGYAVDENDAYIKDEKGKYIVWNNCDVSSPALSYNAIAVGNCTFVANNDEEYTMNAKSSYKEQEHLTNKPDISAFGTNVIMLNGSESFNYVYNIGSGTSFAAPQVAGAVALMMQANPYLIGRPTAVKAILLNSADEDAISFELNDGVEENGIVMDDPIIYDTSKIQSSTGILREKSGAGLLNIEAAIRMSNSNLYYDFTMGQASTSVMPDTDTTMTTETYYFNAGTTIEFGLVYEKATDELLTDFNFNDLDIRIFDSNDNFVFASSDYINNVEMFKCTFAASGEYKFDIFCYNAEAPINATFILSCSCKEKMLTHSNYQLTQHTVSCDAIDGCGFNCYEKHRSISVSKNFGYGTSATFKVYYLFEKGNRQTPMFDYFEISVEDGVSTQGRLWIINPDGMTTSTNPTGETRTYTYSATIELPDGNPVFPTASFIVRIDYFDKMISIE